MSTKPVEAYALGWCREYARLFAAFARKPVEDTCVHCLPNVTPNPAVVRKHSDGARRRFISKPQLIQEKCASDQLTFRINFEIKLFSNYEFIELTDKNNVFLLKICLSAALILEQKVRAQINV